MRDGIEYVDTTFYQVQACWLPGSRMSTGESQIIGWFVHPDVLTADEVQRAFRVTTRRRSTHYPDTPFASGRLWQLLGIHAVESKATGLKWLAAAECARERSADRYPYWIAYKLRLACVRLRKDTTTVQAEE